MISELRIRIERALHAYTDEWRNVKEKLYLPER